VQTAPSVGDPGGTLARVEALLLGASKQRASLVVLPELFPFYLPLSASRAAEAAALSQVILRRLQASVREWGFYLVASLVELDEGRLYSTAYLLGRDGSLAGKYRKAHLSAVERAWASPGDELPVFATDFCIVGILLGSEMRVFEAARVLAAQGADLLAVPASWQDRHEGSLHVCERALENRVFVAVANRLDTPIAGRSKVVTPSGTAAAEGTAGTEQFVKAYVNLALARDKCVGPDTDVFRHRTPEAYGALTRLQRAL